MAKGRNRRKAKPAATPKLDVSALEITHEAKEIFALAMEGAGGLARLIEFMRSSNANYGQVVAHYSKLIPMTVGAQVNHKIDSAAERTALETSLETSFANLIRTRREEAKRLGVALIEAAPNPDAHKNIHTMVDQLVGVVPTPEEARNAVLMIGDVAYRRVDPVTIDNELPKATITDNVNDPSPEPPAPAPAPPRSEPKLVHPAKISAEALSPEAARERAMAPSYPSPINNGEPSTTEKYLEWASAGGWGRRGSDWENKG